MAGYCHNLERAQAGQTNRIAIGDCPVDQTDLGWADDGQCREMRLERSQSIGMVIMMMGNQDVAELTVLLFEKGQQGAGVTGVDCNRIALIVQNPDIIVAECGNRGNGEHDGKGLSTMIKSFSRWLTETALGRYLLQQEQAWFDRAVADAFGYRAVQIGVPQVDLLRKNRIAWRCRAGRKPVGADIVCDPAQLPFASASLDLLLMPHGLDFTIFPHQVLREVERVLVPEGRLILTGFNPVSLWGVRRMVQGRTEAPWSGNFFPLLRVKDWLALLDLEPGGGAFIGYAPPVARADWLERCRFMEAAGDRWWPLAAGVYGIEAVKRQRGMRLLTPSWRKQKAGVLVGTTGARRTGQSQSASNTDEII